MNIPNKQLRDLFAMAAIVGKGRTHSTPSEIVEIAEYAYAIADAMLEERRTVRVVDG